VAISGDTAVIGAPGDDENGIDSGTAYVYLRSGTSWSLQQKLPVSDAEAPDWFGSSVAISGDTALVGAPFDDDAGSGAGSVYIYVRSGTTWSLEEKLLAPGNLWQLELPAADNFGCSVALDGTAALIGAKDFTDYGTGAFVGTAYLYVRDPCSDDWKTSDQLLANPASDRTAGDNFGYSVALQGTAAVVGAKDFDVSGTLNTGAAFAFTLHAADADADGLPDVHDNCPQTHQEDPQICNQPDQDGDGVGDVCDNCPSIYNPPPFAGLGFQEQLDWDSDDFGNECDCPEIELAPFDDSIHPGAPEICDWTDNDCDGGIDEVAGSALTRPTLPTTRVRVRRSSWFEGLANGTSISRLTEMWTDWTRRSSAPPHSAGTICRSSHPSSVEPTASGMALRSKPVVCQTALAPTSSQTSAWATVVRPHAQAPNASASSVRNLPRLAVCSPSCVSTSHQASV
jgi:hypothetical protein